jgi:hypothetical protein
MNTKTRRWIRYGLTVGVLFAVVIFFSARIILSMRPPLVQNEGLWLSRKPKHYTYEVRFAGGLRFAGPVRVEVKNDKAISVIPAGEFVRLDSDIIDQLNTIDKVFAFIRETLKIHNDSVELEFDKTWGFPSKAMMQAPWTEGDRWVDITSFKQLN